MAYNSREEAILAFQVKRNVTRLFKAFLSILEREKDQHDEAMEKLRDALPDNLKEYVNLADNFTDAKADALRKEVLEKGNDCIRDLEQELKQTLN